MPLFYEPVSNCPICSSNRLTFDLVMHYWREYPLTYSHCGECGASFANPMPSTELITRGNSALVRWLQKDRTFDHEFRDARQAYLRGKLLGGRLSRWRREGRLLDLGCYNG